MNILSPIFRRSSTWIFISASVAFLSVYGVQDRVDPVLLLNVIKAFLAILGITAASKAGYDLYQEYQLTKVSADVVELLKEKNS